MSKKGEQAPGKPGWLLSSSLIVTLLGNSKIKRIDRWIENDWRKKRELDQKINKGKNKMEKRQKKLNFKTEQTDMWKEWVTEEANKY